MTGLVARVHSRFSAIVRFVEAYLGLGILIGVSAAVLHDWYGEPLPSPGFELALLAAVLVGTWPFATGRLSTDWLGNYLVGFVVAVFLLGSLLALGGLLVDGERLGAAPAPALLAVAHAFGLAVVIVTDASLRREPTRDDA